MIEIRPTEISKKEQVYLFAIAKALWVTLRRLMVNMWGFISRKRSLSTLEYPEEKKLYSPRARLFHRLTKREDGSPKCVACSLCSTVCPANAIEIIADEAPNPETEKKPISFVIDGLRCVYCGLCVEVCPKDAIRMDSKVDFRCGNHREDFFFTLHDLLEVKPRASSYPGDREKDAKKEAGLL